MSIANFLNPPISEVVFGAEFIAPEFSSVHFGQYWLEIKDRYPQYSDLSPMLPAMLSPMGGFTGFSNLPPLRRMWFQSPSTKRLIQLQSNSFFYNWRREDSTENYPRFENIYSSFIQEWEKFTKWWKDVTNSPISPISYQLTYLNELDDNLGWKGTEDDYNIFTFKGREWNEFLPAPKVHVSNMQFVLPDNIGTLLVNTRQGIKPTNNNPVIVFELTVKSPDSSNDIQEWFDKAHETIVRSFLELTTVSAQQEWGLQNE